VLDEMARRKMAAELQKHYDAQMAAFAGKVGANASSNLELLTALRRSQGNADPLKIHLKFDGRGVARDKFQKPQFIATIENVDWGLETVNFREGGDYRGGRLEKWRFELLDEHSRVVSGVFLHGGGDGMSTSCSLGYGQKTSWNYRFDLRSYLAPPPPGKYWLKALFHNDEHISGLRDVDGLMVTKSDPILIVVKSRPRIDDTARWFDIPLPVALLLGCVAVTFASMGRSESGRLGISRRDFRWGMAILLLAAAMWLSEGWLFGSRMDEIRHFDAGDWSIRLAEADRLRNP
jgi:hypothetical protein